PDLQARKTIRTWVNSQWKFIPLPGQLSVEINNHIVVTFADDPATRKLRNTSKTAERHARLARRWDEQNERQVSGLTELYRNDRHWGA
ncbi:hypothetical protein, partial [Pacificimonas flava]|uniref:hypothetical protein n=1 Tax=Pacificimonas flava TaxID=1234595 RepID=UPI001A9C29D6